MSGCDFSKPRGTTLRRVVFYCSQGVVPVDAIEELVTSEFEHVPQSVRHGRHSMEPARETSPGDRTSFHQLNSVGPVFFHGLSSIASSRYGSGMFRTPVWSMLLPSSIGSGTTKLVPRVPAFRQSDTRRNFYWLCEFPLNRFNRFPD